MNSQLIGLVAYPSTPRQVGETIMASLEQLRAHDQFRHLESWEQHDIPGRFLVDPIIENIERGNILVADVSRLNFNVAYEIGYAIGKLKRVYLIRNRAFKVDESLIREIGLYDTLGYISYENSEDLCGILSGIDNLDPLQFESQVNTSAPVFIVTPRTKTDHEIRILSRVKKARLQFRSYDPEEVGRLPARLAIEEIASSYGVIIPLVPDTHAESRIHNNRAAFCAGVANALDKDLLLLQSGDDPVPIDYRDLVKSYKFPDQIDDYIAEFSPSITAKLQQSALPLSTKSASFLSTLSLGASAAENEFNQLDSYYLESDEFSRALRGEVQIVAGRKGTGKTALFSQVRNRLRQYGQRVVLDLKPEGFQLLRFKETVLDFLEEGTKEHTITAFWEYLLLLEICQKIIQNDRVAHTRNNELRDPYQSMAQTYLEDSYITEGDFAERMLILTQRISDDYEEKYGAEPGRQSLSGAEVTEILYKHDVGKLRSQVVEYLHFKEGLWVLFDNLDKGWPPQGVSSDDLVMLRTLIDALSKLERSLQRRDIECHGMVFIRNDVYDLLLENTPDRGKISRATLDWADAELLRELLRRRLVYSGAPADGRFEELWREICVSHVSGEESSQYLIDRCLMRPRALIELVQHCRSHAVNLGHPKIEEDDIRSGEEAFSTDLVSNITFEMRDICSESEEIMYEFIEMKSRFSSSDLDAILKRAISNQDDRLRVYDLLLWHGVLGCVRAVGGDASYIYSVKYDIRRLKALIHNRPGITYEINPAFWMGLEVSK